MSSTIPRSSRRPLEVLMAEDSPADVLLTRRAFDEAGAGIHLHVVKDGIEALEFLRRQGSFADAPPIDLLLLDWNMPRMGGRDVLRELKRDEQFQGLPVVVLTTSDAEQDVCESYRLQANAYVAKPVDFDRFRHVMKTIVEFWFDVAKLPGG